jgi:hypothetical protein
MSSLKGTAKAAVRRAANAASRPQPPAAPALPKSTAKDASAEAKKLAATIERAIADGKLDVLSTDALQGVMAAACRLYAARREANEDVMPVGANALAATDVMVTASGLLRACGLAAFELGMWQGFTGR